MQKAGRQLTIFSHFILRHRLLGLCLLILLISLLYTYLNRFNTNQAGALSYHLSMMEYYKGTPGYPYRLYPLWGYPLLLSLFGNYQNIIYLQAIAGGIALIAFFLVILNKLTIPSLKYLWTFLTILALPFFSVIAVRWPAAMQVIFLVGSITVLIVSFKKQSILFSIIAGLLLGIACNFRSEYLYFPVFLMIGYLLVNIKNVFKQDHIKKILILLFYAVFAYVSMFPLGLERRIKTGEFNIVVGNGNWVNLFFSMGQYQGNKLSLKFNDGWIENYLKKNIPDVTDTTVPVHMQKIANVYCKKAFFDYVSEYPADFVIKISNNFKNILLGGFFYGQGENVISATYNEYIVLMKEYYKKVIGIQNYKENLEMLYEKKHIQDPSVITYKDITFKIIITTFPYMILNLLFLLTFWTFWILLVFRVYILLKKKIKISELELLLGLPVIYGCLMMMLGVYENRFSSIVYVFIIAFIVTQLDFYKSTFNELSHGSIPLSEGRDNSSKCTFSAIV